MNISLPNIFDIDFYMTQRICFHLDFYMTQQVHNCFNIRIKINDMSEEEIEKIIVIW